MAELDYKKFIESIYRQSSKDGWFQSAYRNAIKEQGFSCDEMTGEIVETIMPFKIEKGKWYMCINQYMNCIEGRVYQAISDGRIIDNFGTEYSLCNEADNYFRPATDKEIEEISGNQGKNSPNEAKFKKGEWVVYDGWTTQIMEVYEDGYANDRQGFIPKVREDSMRKWTINDAKDGDVLVTQKTDITYESIFIFKKNENNRIIQYLHYFTTDADEEVCEARSIDGFLGFVGTTVHPATKEQCDLLFQKMKEKGYVWDAEKKELKTYASETMNEKDAIDNGFTEMMLKEQKPVEWSEDDELRINSILSSVKYCNEQYPNKKEYIKDIIWLNLLKDRVIPQPKQEWSKEDDKMINSIAVHLNATTGGIPEDRAWADKFMNWLKSLKERTTWKPSGEQMEVLLSEVKAWTKGCPKQIVLESLYQDLKKLKGE